MEDLGRLDCLTSNHNDTGKLNHYEIFLVGVKSVKVATASHRSRKMRDLKLLIYPNDGTLAYYSLKNRDRSNLTIMWCSLSLKKLVRLWVTQVYLLQKLFLS